MIVQTRSGTVSLRSIAYAMAMFVFGAVGCSANSADGSGDDARPFAIESDAGRLIVKFRSGIEPKLGLDRALSLGASTIVNVGAEPLRVNAARRLFVRPAGEGASLLNRFERAKSRFPERAQRADAALAPPDLGDVFVLDLQDASQQSHALAALRADTRVEYAQQDYRIVVSRVPNDPYYSSSGTWAQPYEDLWGLRRLDMEHAWAITRGRRTIVAVIDTGVDYMHPDLAANIWTNPGEVLNGLDDDGNGYIDDVHGWNFPDANNDPMDVVGHGTHVAGIIAAVGNNALGVIGVAPRTRIMPLKSVRANEDRASDLAEAIIYAAENGADVINNSWNCSAWCPENPVIENAVRYAHSLGALVVFAAGNNGDDISLYSPQNMIESRPLVASDVNPVDFVLDANIGAFLDVAAPGQDILSLKSKTISPGYSDDLVVGADYLRLGGTSMAAPHVSAVAALLIAKNPFRSLSRIKTSIRGNVVDIGEPGWDFESGFGRLHAYAALTNRKSYALAHILSPLNGATVNGVVAIKGTAAARYSTSFAVMVGEGATPSSWDSNGITLSQGTVVDGQLAAWNTKGRAAGIWVIRLIVNDGMSTVSQEDIRVTLE